MKWQFKIVFNDYQYWPSITSKLSDNKTIVSWSIILEKVISEFKDKGYTFNHIAEVNFKTKANQWEMSYDFYIRHKMHAVEWKLNALINKDKSLISKLNRNWRHPLNRKIECYRV